jgi:hypothetical protein
MKTEQTIANLIKATIHRAVRESIAGVLVILVFAYVLQHALPGTARYYVAGNILVVAALFGGVTWLNRAAAAKIEESATTLLA